MAVSDVMPLGLGGNLSKVAVGEGGIKIAPIKSMGIVGKSPIFHMRGGKRQSPPLSFDLAGWAGDIAGRRLTSTEIPHEVLAKEMSNPPPTPPVSQETGKKVIAKKASFGYR